MCQYLYQRGMRLTLKGFVERVISENFLVCYGYLTSVSAVGYLANLETL